MLDESFQRFLKLVEPITGPLDLSEEARQKMIAETEGVKPRLRHRVGRLQPRPACQQLCVHFANAKLDDGQSRLWRRRPGVHRIEGCARAAAKGIE